MFGGSGSGSYSNSQTDMSSESDFWTERQHMIAEQLGSWMSGQDLSQGMKKYGGQLAGTYTPGSMKSMFSGAQAYASGNMQGQGGAYGGQAPEGSQLFQHYNTWKDPQAREAAIGERMGARERMLAPGREKEDAALKAQLNAMGLSSSSDAIKAQMDTTKTREAEADYMASGLRDRYEELGFQASEAGMNRLSEISQMDYQVKNAGLEAEFNEWLRTQPEYSPMIEMMMNYLGLQGVSSTEGSSNTTAWSVSGSAGGASDEAVKDAILKLNAYSFTYKPTFDGPTGTQIGLMAQEVEKVWPHLVENIDGVKHINYATLSAILLLELKKGVGSK